MSVELAFINQLLTKPTGAATVSLTAGGAITKGSEITINNDGEAELSAYNIIPDNTISSEFLDYLVDYPASTSPINPMGDNSRFQRLITNPNMFVFLYRDYDTGNSYYNVKLITFKLDPVNGTLSAGSSLVIRNASVANVTPSLFDFMVVPEEDYIIVTVGGRQFMTNSTNYRRECYRVSLNSATGSLSGLNQLFNDEGTSSAYQQIAIGEDSYYAAGATLGDRYFYVKSYYSTTFYNVNRCDLNGSRSAISTDFSSTVGGSWYQVHETTRSHGKQLHYLGTTNQLYYCRDLTYFTNSNYWGYLQITPATGEVAMASSYCLYADREPDANNIVRYIMWDGYKYVTTYQIQVDPTGSVAPSFSGSYTTTITDANILLSNNGGIGPNWGSRHVKVGDDIYFATPNTKLTSDSTDSPTDYQANMIKLTYSSTNGGYYTMSYVGIADMRLPGTSTAQYAPQIHHSANGMYLITLSSDWSTTDGTNDHKHAAFKVSSTGLSDATYAYKVKAVALEDAAAGATFSALSYAPVVSDATLVGGTVYDRHIATSNGLLLEKA